MNTDPRPIDYAKAKPSVLQQLAGAGNADARRELERRGVVPASPVLDVTTLDAVTLRAMVAAWRQGDSPAERAEHFARAQQAQDELEVRYVVDAKLSDGRAGQPPAVAPWRRPQPPRCAGWSRPGGSTLYPSQLDINRAGLAAIARQIEDERKQKATAAAGVPQRGQ